MAHGSRVSWLVMENPSPPFLGLARSLVGCRLFDHGLGYLLRLAAHCTIVSGLHEKKPPLDGAAGRSSWKTSFEGRDQWLKDLSLGVLHTGELGLAQPFGLEDLLADQG